MSSNLKPENSKHNEFRPARRIATIAQVAAAYPAFSPAALRDLVFKAEDRFNSRGEKIRGNGLAEAGAIVRIGRRVLIDLDSFECWIDSQRSGARRAA